MEAATRYVDAGHSYKKCDDDLCALAYSEAAKIYKEIGRFRMAAQQHQVRPDAVASHFFIRCVSVPDAVPWWLLCAPCGFAWGA